ncbi:hypothetical protein GUITHDRAFT_142701 [Guillardia theta CCMP2712]|uniref:Fibrinogen C-terminal domain-containing protein n=1 Tax=Guillardia theta (strain CCMP2712) TaxID=905079 RepID=L1IWJ5_GUITC|nr:hypothetical protein GUITHDRAFT_142701 [Guillardia theta CCMP2712]EKX40611.1 hypothetical protein GUITHDRAFT_142701 [Guillardia theta CCMP2712]|eukprot:XP_005827591.1 hypothetical protein GUITHDRAFT_142701 [Guillardia theta CCMP2712]
MATRLAVAVCLLVNVHGAQDTFPQPWVYESSGSTPGSTCDPSNPATCSPSSYSHDPNARNPMFFSSRWGNAQGVDSDPGGFGMEGFPARSCLDLAKKPYFSSGVYWLQPAGYDRPFQGYCDMDSFGGGWLMCYTTSDAVHMSTETSSSQPYGVDGYRSDCTRYPFNQVMYVYHPTLPGSAEDKAWFSFRGQNALVAQRSGFSGSVNASWAAGSGVLGLLFDSKYQASSRTPSCIQERTNFACKVPVVVGSKFQECPDCFAVQPQMGNASCTSPDFSVCWCDPVHSSGCVQPNSPPVLLQLSAQHDAVTNFYAGWVVMIVGGTGSGQTRMILSSTGGSCSSSSFSTAASCIDGGATWMNGPAKIQPESTWATLPCSDPKVDGYICNATCTDTYPADGTTCNNGEVYPTLSTCSSACQSYTGASSCSYRCTTVYKIYSPYECTDLDWECGYFSKGGVRRGYTPSTVSCTGQCQCDNAGVPRCSGGTGTCTCIASESSSAPSSAPWSQSVFRLASGVNPDGCTGAFRLCQGSNPYAGYQLVINGQTRTIVGYSGYHKVVKVDSPLQVGPVPAPSEDATYEMKLAQECSNVYNNQREKSACAATQYYQVKFVVLKVSIRYLNISDVNCSH